MAPPRRITTIAQAGVAGGSSKALSTPSRIQVTDAAVRDPARLSRVLSDIQSAQEATSQANRANPLSAPCIIRGVDSPTTSSTLTIRHTLGRPLTGWWVIRAHGHAPAFRELLPGDSGYPVGIDLSTALVVVSGSTGTFDFAIVGD